MKIKIIEKKEDSIVFELSETNEAEVNTLRRLIVSEVPTMAIEEVEFIKNDSALFDEMIANRLGLIPLKTDLKVYKEDKKGDVLSQVEFSLKAKGPCTVYSGDLKSTDDKIVPVFDKMPIVKLLEGQELELNAIAVLGRGRTHMKFAPGAVFYHHKPILKINNDPKKLEQFKDKYPSKAFKDGKLDEEALLKDNLYEACDGICDDLLKVDYEKDKFIFYVESFGQLEVIEMVMVAVENFNKKLEEFEKALKSTKDTLVKNVAKKLTLKK